MKTYSSEAPKQYWYDRLKNNDVDLYLTENIVQAEDGYEFDLYIHKTKWTENLDERLAQNHTQFLLIAKELELDKHKNQLRKQREIECFAIVNRGVPYWNKLTGEQKQQLSDWYNAWLSVTETLKEPLKPEWIK